MNTFKRYEKKYLLTKGQFMNLYDDIKKHIAPDKFSTSTICNLYYDTDSSLLIRSSIEKPNYKEKLRIRSYNTPTIDDKVYVEIKKKYDGIVYKRREDFTLKEALQFMNHEKHPTTQIQDELCWFMNAYENLVPSMYISYKRYSYKSNDDANLRITIDTDILYRTDKLDLSLGSFGNRVLEQDKCILEIKTTTAMPLWLCEALNRYNIYPASFSKYGVAYKKEIEGEIKRNEYIN